MSQLITFPYMGPYIQEYATEYTNTQELLTALNFDTTGMTFLDDLNSLAPINIPNIHGKGSVTLGYVKSHVIPSAGGVAPFTISSIMNASDNETFEFNNMTYYDSGDGLTGLVIGNAGIVDESLANSDPITFLYIPEEGITEFFGFNCNPPAGHELFELPVGAGLDEYLTEVFDGSDDPLDFVVPLMINLTVTEAYTQDKLDGKWVDIDTTVPVAGHDEYEIGGVYVPYSSYSTTGLTVSSDGKLSLNEIDASSLIAPYIVGDGLTIYTSDSRTKLKVDNASDTKAGGIKIKVTGTTCYITTNGSTPGQ